MFYKSTLILKTLVISFIISLGLSFQSYAGMLSKNTDGLIVTVQSVYNEPIENAMVFLNNDDDSYVFSDENGQVHFPINSGVHTVWSYKAGFLDNHISVDLSQTETHHFSITHEPAVHWTTELQKAPIGASDQNGLRLAAIDHRVYYWPAYGGEPGHTEQGPLTDFYAYNAYEDQWTQLDDAPFAGSYGIGTASGVNQYDHPSVYIVTGLAQQRQTRMARYNTVSNNWETDLNTDIPWAYEYMQASNTGWTQGYARNGATLVYTHDDFMYFFPGAGYSYANYDWYRYSISQDNWEAMGELPHRQGPGNAATYVNGDAAGLNQDYIYIQFGVGPSGSYMHAEFWRYGLNDHEWEKLTKHQYGADDGSALVWDGENYIYHTPGAFEENNWDRHHKQKREFMRYSIDTNNWTELEKTPYHPWGGWDDAGGIVMVNNNILGMKGGDDVAWADDFSRPGGGDIANNQLWKYVVSPEDHNNYYSLEVFDSEGSGTINLEKGTLYFPANEVISIDAFEDAGWVFDRWLVNGEFYCINATNTILLDENKTLQAIFAGDPSVSVNMPQASKNMSFNISQCMLTVESSKSAHLEIINLTGKKLIQKRLPTGMYSARLEHPNGIYILKLEQDGVKPLVEKIYLHGCN